jgi:hypothetical protein
VHTGFWLGDLKERGHLENLGVDGKININMDFKERAWEGVN